MMAAASTKGATMLRYLRLFFRFVRRTRICRRVALRVCQGVLIHVAVAVVRSSFDLLFSGTPWA